jgi:hypothetical protein
MNLAVGTYGRADLYGVTKVYDIAVRDRPFGRHRYVLSIFIDGMKP